MGLLLLMGSSDTVPPSFSGALDGVTTDLLSAWSVSRRLLAAYTGPLVRVRRSTDNTEQDFSGSGSEGAVDAAAVASFCGAGDGFLVTVYDQSGLGRHFTQSSTTIQPIVCESGVAVTAGSRLGAKFVDVDLRRMSVASSTAFYNALHTTGGTVAFVLQVDDTASTKVICGNSGATGQGGFQFLFTNAEAFSSRASRLDVAGTPTSGNSVSSTHSSFGTAHSVAICSLDPDNGTAANRSLLWRNGTSIAGNNSLTGTPRVENAANDFLLGASTGIAAGFDGIFQELAVWSNLISTVNRDSYEANAGTFYGITVA